IYRDPVLMTGFVVSNDTLRKLVTDLPVDIILVKSTPGSDPDTVEAGLNSSLAAFPGTKVQSNAAYKAEFEDQLNSILYILYALLVMSVLISLFGIVNTLVLTIYE